MQTLKPNRSQNSVAKNTKLNTNVQTAFGTATAGATTNSQNKMFTAKQSTGGYRALQLGGRIGSKTSLTMPTTTVNSTANNNEGDSPFEQAVQSDT